MARLYEFYAFGVLASAGVRVPRHRVADSTESAVCAAEELGLPVILKSHVPVGGRAKAGGVIRATAMNEIEPAAARLLGTRIRGFEAREILMVEEISIAQELYAAVAYDSEGRPALLTSVSGGVDIEDVEEVHRMRIDPLRGLLDHHARRAWKAQGISGRLLKELPELCVSLWKTFCETAATIIEVNPLAVDHDGELVAVSVLMGLDEDGDHALLRQSLSDRSFREETSRERAARMADHAEPFRGTARFTELDGDIGLVCGGGGASLAIMDLLRSSGLHPANYAEVGGNPSATKVEALTRVVLSKRPKALLVCQNVTNNTQLDEVARGVTSALLQLSQEDRCPVIIRQAGLHQERAREIYETAGIEWHGDDWTLEDAVKAVRDAVAASS